MSSADKTGRAGCPPTIARPIAGRFLWTALRSRKVRASLLVMTDWVAVAELATAQDQVVSRPQLYRLGVHRWQVASPVAARDLAPGRPTRCGPALRPADPDSAVVVCPPQHERACGSRRTHGCRGSRPQGLRDVGRPRGGSQECATGPAAGRRGPRVPPPQALRRASGAATATGQGGRGRRPGRPLVVRPSQGLRPPCRCRAAATGAGERAVDRDGTSPAAPLPQADPPGPGRHRRRRAFSRRDRLRTPLPQGRIAGAEPPTSADRLGGEAALPRRCMGPVPAGRRDRRHVPHGARALDGRLVPGQRDQPGRPGAPAIPGAGAPD